MLKEFKEYVNEYDMNNHNIKYRYNHSLRVQKICVALAKMLNLNKEDAEIIKIAGLLHDIGRFEQLKLTNSFSDNEFDHAAYGAMILFKEGLIENFNVNPKYYDILEFAILNHNRFKIMEINDERKIMIAKILRDADKIDIFDAYTYQKIYKITNIDDEVSNEVSIQFKKHESINKKIRQTKADLLLSIIAFVFDINYKESLEIINEQKYLDELYNQIENKEKFKEYFEYAKDYIKERIDEYAR